MKDKYKNVVISAAWPYVNGEIHIGHLVGYFIPADITARYFRLRGHNVAFVSGTDCHGTPITVEADKKGVRPQDIVDEYDPKVRDLIKLYDISYDNFTKTTTENHKKVVQKMFLDLLENGYIIKQKSKQYYSSQEDKFLPDRYVEGECPYCHSKDQRADQCENCGRSLGLGELINPKSKLTQSEVELKETEHYFIDFPKLQDKIKKFVEEKGGEWRDWIYNETLGWLNEGLQPRAITRDLDWGVEIPISEISEDMQIENSDSKRFYVWFEAVIGYLSATIEFCEKTNQNYEDFWKNEDALHYYFMGQDNLTFHTIFWPGQLIGSDESYNLPDVESVVKFLNANGKKLSKSRGNIIDAKQVGEYFGTELVKFYILSILPENKESNWDWKHFTQTINSELVGNIGNFIHRTITFAIQKLDYSKLSDIKPDSEIVDFVSNSTQEIFSNIEKSRLGAAFQEIINLSNYGNQYFDKNAPWKQVKENEQDALQTIADCLAIILGLRKALYPILPEAMDKLSEYLGIEKIRHSLGFDNLQFDISELQKINISADVKPIFAKLDEKYVENFYKKEESKDVFKLTKSQKSELISKIKVVKILEITKHPDADKLVVTKVYDGQNEIQVVTGAPNVEVGQLVPYLGVGEVVPGFLFAENKSIRLEKKPIRGVDSYGMLLAEDEIGLGTDHDGILILDCGEEYIGKSILELAMINDKLQNVLED